LLSLNSYTVEKIKNAEVMVIGCSAGGFSLMFDILLSLPAEFPLAVVVIIHRSRKHKSSMEALLQKRTKVTVKLADGHEQMKTSVVYFAPTDYHLLLEPNGTFTLDCSEPLFFCRPAIDVTFESVSDVCKDKVIGLLLSGANQDGANGLAYIEANGGLAVVQDPSSAEVDVMPSSAIGTCKNPLVLNNSDIFELVSQITALKRTLN
jgi:two-component system chemotaxis response regulator CheB